LQPINLLGHWFDGTLTEIGDVRVEANFCSVNSVDKANTADQKLFFLSHTSFLRVATKLGFTAWLGRKLSV